MENDDAKEILIQTYEDLKLAMKEMSKMFMGHEDILKIALGAYLVGGHILVEDIPGLGKTTLAKTLATSLGGLFTRLQFTPDLMPSDVLGVSIYNRDHQRFEYQKGPIFCNLLMADEINRASPKTQSSLLEAMEERQVSVDGNTYILPEPFMVIATQNPAEFEGTFPLPEAQLDRFLIAVHLGYTKEIDELSIYKKEVEYLQTGKVEIQATLDYVQLAKQIRQVHVSEAIYTYAYRIVAQTRNHLSLYYGLSPRAGIGILKMAKYWAFLDKRTYVIPEDIKRIAPYVMGHRLLLKPEAKYRGETVSELIETLLNAVPIPKGEV